MTTGVLCSVYVDGVRAADGSPGDDLANPIVLDDLAVTWGRADTMSQPDPDSCSFEVMDAAGGTAFGDVYRVGRRIDVVATGETFPDPTVPTFLNPGFEYGNVTWVASASTATRSTTRAHSGSYSLAVKPTTAAGGSVLLAPAPFSEPGEAPDAWDSIPTTSVGETWSLSVAVLAPVGATVALRPVRFSGPYETAVTVLPVATTAAGTGAWDVVTFETDAVVNGAWYGVQLDVAPVGPTWDEMPPTLAWNAVEPTLRWDELGTVYVDDVTVLAPASGTGRSVLVFSGRVTDVSAAWDDVVGGPVVQVTAAGFTADLENRTIGDEPWTVESVDARAHRILDLADLPISIDIADTLDVILLSYRDVDAQGATGLLQEIATSVDGVLWPAVHQSIGAYLELEDPSQRASLLGLSTIEVEGPPVTTVRTNLAVNPGFETQIAPWAQSTGITLQARSTLWAHEGAYSFRVQTLSSSSASVGDVRTGSASTFPNGIVPGGTYTVSAWQNTPAAHVLRDAGPTSRQRRILYWYATDGSTFIPAFGPVAPNVAGAQRLAHTFTVPANATGVMVAIGCAGSGSDPSFVSYVDDILIEAGSTLGSNFTGATPDTPTTDYAWTGTPENSASTATTSSPGPPVDRIVIEQVDPDAAFDLSACLVLRDPVTWVQTVADLVTRVDVGWLVQGVDDDGNPTTTEATVQVVDAALETLYGTRRVQVSTQLQDSEDATDVASRILTRTSETDWRADGITVDDEDVPPGDEGVALLLDLLDGTSRIGAPLVLGDLPSWAPSGARAGVYLEGGTYRYVGGRWVLELVVSAATGLGQSAAWDDLDPSWTWNQWDPAITWNDLRGVAAP